MKKQHRIFQKFLLFVLVFWASLLNAQQYPVQVTPVLLPPYSLRLGDYATTSENKLQLQLLMKDLMEPSHRIKIRFSLESGVNSTTVVQNNPFINGFQEITLYPGTPILLTNIDLRPLFQLENLTGINAVNYARPLPEGMYKFCFQVFDSGTGRALSAKSAAIAYLVQYEPPILNLPQQGEKVLKPGEFQNIVFQWMPRQMAPNTKYIFTLKELWDTQRDPVSGFLSSRIFCQEETYAPTLYYGMDKTALIPGKRYAWQIQAKSGNPVVGNSATEDNGVYKNNGLSEIFYFDYTENCIVPIMLTAKNVGRGKTEIRWSMTGNSSGSLYCIQYRRKGSTAEWARQESYQDMCILTGLKDETEYEYRVGSVCGNLYQTDNTSVITGSNATDNAYAFSEVQTFITDNKETSNSNIQCGILPQVNISNKSPLQTALGTNEVFIAGDFPVTVLQSQGTSGTYTGYGYIEVPYLADTKIKVTFSNIQLNTDKQLIGGILETTYDVNEGNIIKGSDIVETFADFWEGIKELSYDLYDKIKENLDTRESINNIIDNINNYPNFPGEDKEALLDYISSDNLKERLSEIKGNEISKEKFAESIRNDMDKAIKAGETDREYYITVDGEKAYEFDLKDLENEFKKTKTLSNEELNNYNYKQIKIFIVRTEINDFTISTSYLKKGKNSGNISSIVWDIEGNKEKIISFTNERNVIIPVYYTSSGSTFPVCELEIIRVIPNIAYKQGDKIDYIIKEDRQGNLITEIELSGNKVSLRPVFFTKGEQDVGVEDIQPLFERNLQCSYLVKSIKFNEENYDTDKTLEWVEYSLKEESEYEIVTNNNIQKGQIKTVKDSPIVTVVRHRNNEATDYYIEDYYSTFLVSAPFLSMREDNNTMKTGEFDVFGIPYKIPIVHYKDTRHVKLLLTTADANNRQNESPLQYMIDGQIIVLGQEFTIQTPQNSSTLDIKDMGGNIKGKIEFRQIAYTLLSPTLNIVTINTKEIGESFTTVINDLNAIYNTMNVNWQQGKQIELNINDVNIEDISNNEVLDVILSSLKKHSDYRENQYYMIISPVLDGFGGFASPTLSDNWFIVQKTYDKRHPCHELGHCSGLDEYVVNIGLISSSNRNTSVNNNMQYRSTNVMGYSNELKPPKLPLKDFFSWQISVIREYINRRINKK